MWVHFYPSVRKISSRGRMLWLYGSATVKQTKATLYWQSIWSIMIVSATFWWYEIDVFMINKKKIYNFKRNHLIFFSCIRHYRVLVALNSCCRLPIWNLILFFIHIYIYIQINVNVMQQQFGFYLGIMELLHSTSNG